MPDLIAFQLLGRFQITVDEQIVTTDAAHKMGELIIYLLVQRKAAQHRDQIAAHLWPDSAARQARAYLRKALWQLYSAIPEGEAIFAVDGDWITTHLGDRCQLDIAQFEDAYRLSFGVGGLALSVDQFAAANAAVALYHGDLLQGWYHETYLIERERLLRIYLILLDKLAHYCLAHQQFDRGFDYATRLLQQDPARERTHRHLMRLYNESSDRTGALRQYRRCVEILRDELGVAPSARTNALYATICAGGCTSGDAVQQQQQLIATLAAIQQDLDRLQHRLSQTNPI